MKKIVSIIILMALFASLLPAAIIGTTLIASADWQPGDEYKMHWPQFPDPTGWDVCATNPIVLADDFQCTETDWIKNIHFWGSWKNDDIGQIESFLLSIHEDIPASQSPTGYSIPGALLWERVIPIDQFVIVTQDPSPQGWYDPYSGEVIENDHQLYFQYNLDLQQDDWFWQEQGTIYWLNISANVVGTTEQWGWKSSQDHWNDDAVWDELVGWPDNGSGTITFPPDWPYISDEPMLIIDGLPPGTTIELMPTLMDFVNISEVTGGTLGGTISTFDATLGLAVTGTGDLTGFNRYLCVPVSVEIHTGPRNPGDPIQDFQCDLYRLEGELFGDPDFCTLRVRSGTDYGLPSPGQTTLTDLGGGIYNVDSFFDITYQIEFQGCPGSILDGYSGTTTGTVGITIDPPHSWIEMYEPETIEPRHNEFWVALDPAGNLLPGQSGGTDFFGDGWYFYPQYEWWNIWFYDHPFDYERHKEASITFDVQPLYPGPAFIEVAVNWATDIWTYELGYSYPPLPGVTPEDLYIGRDTILYQQITELTHFQDTWYFPDYNPEWVSIDVRGYNVVIPQGSSFIDHVCLPDTQVSLDLAFVITGGEEGLDFGDAPQQYPTLLANNGARHVIGGPWLGGSTTGNPDAETDGQPTGLAHGDDINNIDDEDGVTFTTPFQLLMPYSIDVEYNGPGNLLAWIDWNADGNWQAGEQIENFALGAGHGTHTINGTVPLTSTVGPTYARFRITNDSSITDTTGLASDGEVEDYRIEIEYPPVQYEFGDAPESGIAYPSSGVIGLFPTCINCGPNSWVQHANPQIAWFGPSEDIEVDGNAGNCCPAPGFPPYNQDECFQDGDAGLIMPEPFTINSTLAVVACPGSAGTSLGQPGQMAQWGSDIDIEVFNTYQQDVFVNVLMDWDQNGQWGDMGEHVLQNFPVPVGFAGPLSALVPPDFQIGPTTGFVWSRFTVSEGPVFTDWDGHCEYFDLGETEDYLLLVGDLVFDSLHFEGSLTVEPIISCTEFEYENMDTELPQIAASVGYPPAGQIQDVLINTMGSTTSDDGIQLLLNDPFYPSGTPGTPLCDIAMSSRPLNANEQHYLTGGHINLLAIAQDLGSNLYLIYRTDLAIPNPCVQVYLDYIMSYAGQARAIDAGYTALQTAAPNWDVYNLLDRKCNLDDIIPPIRDHWDEDEASQGWSVLMGWCRADITNDDVVNLDDIIPPIRDNWDSSW